MKLQANELPLGKNQTRKKSTTPKIAPIIALALFLLILIPIYYPLLRYPQKINSSQSSSSFVSLQESIIPTPLSSNDPSSILDNELPKTSSRRPNHDDDEVIAPDNNPNDDVKRPPPPPSPKDEDFVTLLRRPPTKKERSINRRSKSKSKSNNRKGKTKRSSNNLSNPENGEDDVERPKNHRKQRLVGLTPRASKNGKCDIFDGEWIPNPKGPYYTNTTCWAIQEHQNCMKFGKPNSEYMKWRWKPYGCELPIFDPIQFLELVRGKSIAFVGDSVARNHMQSLICLLSRVEDPIDVSSSPNQQTRRYEYRNYNFTIAIFWSPYLVRTTKSDPNDITQTRPFNLFLDEFDEEWTTQIADFDHVIISAGHWFFRPTNFYVGGRLAGCLYCPQSNVTHLSMYFSYRRAFRTAFRAINSLENYRGTTFLRTFAPSHFENGIWNEGGDCQRKRPFKSTEARLDGYNLELYEIQVEELRIAERLGRKRGLKFRLVDVTQAMLLRPDGHPSKYGHWPRANVSLYNDCVHWCLPGPIDTWNDFLLKMLEMEGN